MIPCTFTSAFGQAQLCRIGGIGVRLQTCTRALDPRLASQVPVRIDEETLVPFADARPERDHTTRSPRYVELHRQTSYGSVHLQTF